MQVGKDHDDDDDDTENGKGTHQSNGVRPRTSSTGVELELSWMVFAHDTPCLLRGLGPWAIELERQIIVPGRA